MGQRREDSDLNSGSGSEEREKWIGLEILNVMDGA